MTRVVPGPAARKMHETAALTERHAKRMAAGISESQPEDYQINLSEENVRLRDARKRLEDMKLARELGIDVQEIE